MYDRKPLISEFPGKYIVVSVTGIKYEVTSHLDLCDWYADWKKRGSPDEEALEVYEHEDGQGGKDSSQTILFTMDPIYISAIIAGEEDESFRAGARLLV